MLNLFISIHLVAPTVTHQILLRFTKVQHERSAEDFQSTNHKVYMGLSDILLLFFINKEKFNGITLMYTI